MYRPLIAVVALAVVLAACGGSSSEGVATLEEASAGLVEDIEDAASGISDEEALLAFAQCMRDNGVENFQDPIVDADGSVGFGFGRGGGGQDGGPFGGVDQEIVQGAFQACSDNLEGLAFGPGGGDFDQGEFQDTFIEFTACLRENGLEVDDPEVQAALEACQDIFGGGFGPPRGGGGNG